MTKNDPKIAGQTKYITPELKQALRMVFDFYQKTESQMIVMSGPNMEILVISNNADVIDTNVTMLQDINDGKCPGCGQVHEKGKNHIPPPEDEGGNPN